MNERYYKKTEAKFEKKKLMKVLKKCYKDNVFPESTFSNTKTLR